MQTIKWWLPEGEGKGRMKWINAVKYMVTKENQTLSGMRPMEYTDIKL